MRPPAKPLEEKIAQWVLDTPFFNANNLTNVTRNYFLTIRSPQTCKVYFNALRRFFRGVPPTFTLDDITAEFVSTHLGMIGGEPPPGDGRQDHHVATRLVVLAALRGYFDFLRKKKLMAENPAADIKFQATKRYQGQTEPLPISEVLTLLAHIGERHPLDRRDRALVAFLAFTACRIGAAVKLTHGSFHDASVRLYEKGGKEHPMPLPPPLPPFLEAYVRDLSSIRPDLAFFRKWSKPLGVFLESPLSYFDAYMIIRVRAREAGIRRHVTPHSFRATTLTALLNSGMALDKVRTFANHARTDTTLLYTHDRQLKTEDVALVADAYGTKP